MASERYSKTALSNIYTMGIAAKHDPRQRIPPDYEIPSVQARELRARLILEEALETIDGLGFQLIPTAVDVLDMANILLVPLAGGPDLVKTIDGCCDLKYVAVGAMLVCGAPDLPHQRLVDEANNAKFPGGVAVVDANGKYQKPPGWKPPDHLSLLSAASLRYAYLEERKKE